MLFDAHGDILTDMYQEKKKGNKNSFKKRHLENYKKGGITHSIFVNWTSPKQHDGVFEDIWDAGLKELHENQDIFQICLNTLDMDQSLKEDKIGVIIGMEGIAQLKGVEQLQNLYQKGVRHASLTWNEVNKYAGGLSSETQGLTDEGKKILDEMQRLHMVIDLAHSNPVTFNDILEYTKGPIIISHGNVKSVHDHIRNYTDQQLLRIKERNGVLGLCGIGPFIAKEQEDWTVQNLVKHIDYAVKLMGIDHVGIGLDVCYYLGNEVDDNRVEGLRQISDAPNIFKELEKIGYSSKDINKIKYGNFYRVMKEVLG